MTARQNETWGSSGEAGKRHSALRVVRPAGEQATRGVRTLVRERRGMGHRLLSGIFLSLGVASAPLACGSVSVKPASTAAKAESRPRDCTIEFLRAPPERTYDELGEIYSYYSRVVEPQEVLREKACELGADAVLVTRDFLVSTSRGPDRKLVAGTALRYRDATGVPEPGR